MRSSRHPPAFRFRCSIIGAAIVACPPAQRVARRRGRREQQRRPLRHRLIAVAGGRRRVGVDAEIPLDRGPCRCAPRRHFAQFGGERVGRTHPLDEAVVPARVPFLKRLEHRVALQQFRRVGVRLRAVNAGDGPPSWHSAGGVGRSRLVEEAPVARRPNEEEIRHDGLPDGEVRVVGDQHFRFRRRGWRGADVLEDRIPFAVLDERLQLVPLRRGERAAGDAGLALQRPRGGSEPALAEEAVDHPHGLFLRGVCRG
mmetsp:Transcript_10375/g.32139  ORF Transcript_10375/g.32139 Transcript_10375/m.32139 type:complete len:256 (+) Transcript_10375:1074-1841(+)